MQSLNPTPSKIKDIYIELPNYSFQHSSEPNVFNFIGRKAVKDRLKMLLGQTEGCPSGAYLVTGYRGMGKTSLVKQVLSELNPDKENKRFVDLDISLSQEDVKDMDVLKLMAQQLHDYAVLNRDKFDNEKWKDIVKGLGKLIENIGFTVSKKLIDKSSDKSGLKHILSQRYTAETELQRTPFTTKLVEKQLLKILKWIHELRTDEKQLIPHFVFIVDELDKIEPNFLFDSEKNRDGANNRSMNKLQHRTEVIGELLSNLKHFLTSAKAKFIFIGGREMYDAGLADIADRESFYSSIFHDILYVRSFFKDKITERSGLTQLTENYLARLILVKREYPKEETYNLKTIFHYLIAPKNEGEPPQYYEKIFKEKSNTEEGKIEQHEIYKAIILLQNFILYLTYRSNGSPKKLVSLIENFIVSKKDIEASSLKTTKKAIVFNKEHFSDNDEERLYLRFTYHKQYEIGLTSNLYRPYSVINSRSLKGLGDKLLYSTAYLLDYILKFHRHAFSWRNLEMIPEIILVNKDPNLRQYMDELLRSLSGMYIRETVNSIFQFKFYSKAAHEIQLLTKISEPASAAFNFTLDESEEIKSYYRKQLSELMNAYPKHQEDFIHSVVFLQGLLADLHYFDGEFDKAIEYHTNALQVLRQRVQINPQDVTKHQVVLYVRHKLLLGLSLEKIKAYDSAYSIYRGLILNVPPLLDRVSKIKKDSDTNKIESLEFDGWDKPIRRMQLFIRPHIALLDLIEKQRMDGITYANLLRNFLEVYDFLVEKPYSLKAKRIDAKASKKRKQQDTIRIRTLLSDYYSNVGSLLFYKNHNYSELIEVLHKFDGEKYIDKLYLGTYSNSNEQKKEKEQSISYLPSFSALAYYRLALRDMIANYKPELKRLKKSYSANSEGFGGYSSKDNHFVQAAYLLLPQMEGGLNTVSLYNFGNLIAKIADALLASIPNEKNRFIVDNKIVSLFAEDKFDEVKYSGKEQAILKELINFLRDKSSSPSNYFTIDFVLVLTRLSSLFYRKSGRNYSFGFQYKKILFLLKEYICHYKDKKLESDINKILIEKEDAENLIKNMENVAERIITINTWIQNTANRPQVLKYREILGVSAEENSELYKQETQAIYRSISTSAEIREVIAIVEEIRLSLEKDKIIKTDNNVFFKNIISSTDVVSSRFTRVIELRLQAEINLFNIHKIIPTDQLERHINNFKIDTEEFNKELNDRENNKSTFINAIEAKYKDSEKIKEALENIRNIICDSIFALFEVTKTLKMYGINYIVSNSYFAGNHRNLGRWCQMFNNYEYYIDSYNNREKYTNAPNISIRQHIESILGSKEEEVFIEPNFHYEIAAQYYNAAIQVHIGGKAYRDLNQSMSFLEDDYNDSLTHFCAASERFRINTGMVRNQISTMKNRIKVSRVFSYDNYRLSTNI